MHELTQKTILLVEDEAIIAMTEKKILEKYGYTVITASSGEKAIELIDNSAGFDLILMDIDLGKGLDGTQTAAEILSKRDIPVVFLSSHTEPEVVEKTEKITSYGYVVKNTSNTVLDASIKMAFKLFEAKRKNAEKTERILKIEEQLSLINNSSNDSIYSYDLHGRFTSANKKLCELLGLDEARILGRTHQELHFPDGQCREWECLHEAVKNTNATVISETTAQLADGTTQYFSVTLDPLHDAGGAIIGIGGNTRNITVQKLAEIALQNKSEEYEAVNEELRASLDELNESTRRLQESEERYNAFINASTDMIFIKDGQLRYLTVNNAMAAFFGRNKEDIVGRTDQELSDGARVLPCGSSDLRALTSESSFTVQEQLGDIFCETTKFPMYFNNKAKGVGGIIRDVTERKKLETVLEESGETYRSIIAASPDSICITDLESRILFVSPRTMDLMGKTEDRLIGYLLNDFILIDDRKKAAENIALMFQGVMTGIGEYRAVRDDGTIIDIEVNAEFIRNAQGLPVKIVFIVRDISSRNRMINRYKVLFELLPVGMAMINHKTGAFLEANKAILESTGYTKEEFLKLTFWDITPNEYQEQEDEQFKELNETEIFTTNEKEYIRKDGSRYPVAISGAKLTDETGTEVVWGIIEDITERKRAEQEIKSLLAEKELLLKEVHHRIKNNMNTAIGLLALQAGTVEEKSARTALEDAGSRLQSMALLYEKLYQTAGYAMLSTEDYLSSLIDEIVSHYSNAHRMTVTKNIQDFSLPANQLQPLGIIINELITNIMKYAFPGRTDGEIAISVVLKDDQVTVMVADNGGGMPESVDFDNSTGFGLILVKGLARQLGGKIRIERGPGTKIILAFPLER